MSHGPDRSELWFRFLFSLGGLILVVVALAIKGFSGPAWVEAAGIGGVFFGASAAWCAWKLFVQS
ncbi:MAG: hypothetical protein AAFR93_12220 [Pseudomonadota bacterium]